MFKTLLPSLFLATALTAFGSASPTISSCGTGTLSSYVGSFAPPSLGCSIGILDYSNFNYTPITNAPSSGNIELTPSGQGFSFTQVGGSPFVASGDIIKFAIYYNIFIDPAPVIAGADTSIDPPVGNVSITEYFCNDSVLYPGTTSCFPPTFPVYSLTVTTASPTASVTFNPPAQSYETVGIIFTLDGTNGPASFDGLDASVQVTPEPASAFMVGLFLIAGGYKLRKQRQN